MTANDPYNEVMAFIDAGENFLISTHMNPDGDGVGSMLSLAIVLDACGKKATLTIGDPIPDSLGFLPGSEIIRTDIPDGEHYDAAIMVDCAEPKRAGKAFAEKVRGILAGMDRENLSVQVWTRVGIAAGYMRFARSAYDVIALVFFILASTVIVNTTMMVIYERMREIGTVAAMGMTPREIVRLFFLEAFYIGVIAAFIGVMLGIGITIPLSKVGIDLTQSMQGVDMEINPVVYPQLNIRSTVFIFFYSTIIASLASFIPSRRAAKIQPVEALRAV